MSIRHLLTAEGQELCGIPHNAYPRPQLKRKDWLCLNGEWDFETTRSFELPERYSRIIRVPFCPESLLSGINENFEKGTVFCYRRSFSLPESFKGKKLLLHFGAVDQICRIYINGVQVCENRGGYLPFTAEISRNIQNENEITVLAVDELDHDLPWGKQRRDRKGMWYTPVSGIWQTIWLEPVPDEYISGVEIKVDGEGADLTIYGAESGSICFESKTLSFSNGQARLKPECPELWSPENPKLYDFSIIAGDDEVSSYFALRTLSVETVNGKKRLCLNGKPYFFHGLLDQGYWSDGIYTPAAPCCYEKDIAAMKSLGFNTLRKHIKIEAERFYYDCDRLGMIVFQDMVNNGSYSFIKDTALPTAGLQRFPDFWMNRGKKSREFFLEHMERTVKHLGNHPCICCWTIFNEGWGQFNADEAYLKLKKLDSARFIDPTSGWFSRKLSDVESLHIYFKKLRLGSRQLPQLLSEFGGYSYKLPEHSANLEKTYGYKLFSDRESYVSALRSLYLVQLLPLIPQGLCGAIYTQVSDVEDETNGLLTCDRRVRKLQPGDFTDISEKLCAAIKE